MAGRRPRIISSGGGDGKEAFFAGKAVKAAKRKLIKGIIRDCVESAFDGIDLYKMHGIRSVGL